MRRISMILVIFVLAALVIPWSSPNDVGLAQDEPTLTFTYYSGSASAFFADASSPYYSTQSDILTLDVIGLTQPQPSGTGQIQNIQDIMVLDPVMNGPCGTERARAIRETVSYSPNPRLWDFTFNYYASAFSTLRGPEPNPGPCPDEPAGSNVSGEFRGTLVVPPGSPSFTIEYDNEQFLSAMGGPASGTIRLRVTDSAGVDLVDSNEIIGGLMGVSGPLALRAITPPPSGDTYTILIEGSANAQALAIAGQNTAETNLKTRLRFMFPPGAPPTPTPTPTPTTTPSISPGPQAEVWVDDNWVGEADGFLVGPGKYFGINAFDTIQGGVNAAAPAGTVNVAAGTYNGTINVDGRTGINIVGENRDAVIVRPASALPWSVSPRTTGVRVMNSTAVNISNITFDFDAIKGNNVSGVLFWSSTGALENNFLKNMGLPDAAGYYEITSYFRAPGAPYSDAARAPIRISGNVFENTGRIGVITHGYVDATIENNTFRKTMDDFGYGIELGSYSTGRIAGNNIHGYDTPAASDDSASAGIYVENAFTSTAFAPGLPHMDKVVTISGNNIYGNQYGIWIGNEYNGYAGDVDIKTTLQTNNIHDNLRGGVYVADEDRSAGSSVSLHATGNTVADNGQFGYLFWTNGNGEISADLSWENIYRQTHGIKVENLGGSGSLYTLSVTASDITGNTTAVANGVLYPVNAECNYWGDPTGPLHSTNPLGRGNPVTDGVDYSPWLEGAPPAQCGVPPTVSATLSGALGNNGWYRSPVVLEISASDRTGGSGVQEINYQVNSNPPVVVRGASANVTVDVQGTSTVAYWAVDNAGNFPALPAYTTFKIDSMPPIMTFGPLIPGVSDTAATISWSSNRVTLDGECSDSGSGVESCPLPKLIVDQGYGEVTLLAEDKAGNVATRTFYTRIDSTPPTGIFLPPVPLPNTFGWNREDVSVTLRVSDSLSGVKTPPPIQFVSPSGGECTGNSVGINLSEPEGDLIEVTYYIGTSHAPDSTKCSVAIRDVAGNTATFVPPPNVDKIPPTVDISRAPAANAFGWHNTPVSVTFTISDGLSGPTIPTEIVPLSLQGTHTVTRSFSDRAGNVTTAQTGGISIDTTPPVTLVRVRGEYFEMEPGPVWTGPSPVTVVLWGTDVGLWGSGTDKTYYSIDGGAPQEYTGPFVVDRSSVVRVWSSDKAGNFESPRTYEFGIDGVPPTISGEKSPQANESGWNNGPVTVSFTCIDEGGVSTCPAPTTLSGEGANQSVTGTATDNAGNSASATVGNINIDLEGPAVRTSRSPLPNAFGWHNTPVSVTFTISDGLSGPTIPTEIVPLSLQGTHTVTRSFSDRAGNVTTVQTGGISIDTTPPYTFLEVRRENGTLGQGSGWYRRPVTVVLTGSERPDIAGSGVDKTYYSIDGGAPQEYTGPFVVDRSSVVRFWSSDKAGNFESAQTVELKIDAAEPTVVVTRTPQANANGWNNTDVKATFVATDALSGIQGDSFFDVFFTLEGVNLSASRTFSDVAGNTATGTISGINIDKTGPIVAGAPTTSANANGWHTATVTVRFVATDTRSGIQGDSFFDVFVELELPNQSVSRTFSDKASNSTTGSVSGISVDRTAPAITFAGNAGTYTVDQDVNIGYSAIDAVSGIAWSNGPNAPVPAYSFAMGTNTIEATAADRAGNVARRSTSFVVTVSSASLKNLVNRFVSQRGIANSLTAKLDVAEGATIRGNVNARTAAINAFIDQVQRESGRSLTADQANLLIKLARAL